MPPHSIVFVGTPEFAVPSLQALIDDDAFSVDLVITQPDKPVGRKQVLTSPPVKVLAEEQDIEVWQPKDINKEDLSSFDYAQDDKSPDFLVVVAYGQILSQAILDWPTIAPVNVHPSLLPRWRGPTPMQQAILAGDTVTGVTVQQMVYKLDAGDILSQESVPLPATTTITQLHDQLSQLGATLLVETLKQPLKPQPQAEDDVTICRKLKRSHGAVDPSTMTAQEIETHVRALVPWPGVTCSVDNRTVKLIAVALEPQPESIPLPCTNNTTLHILTLQEPGKRTMNGQEWLRGRGGV